MYGCSPAWSSSAEALRLSSALLLLAIFLYAVHIVATRGVWLLLKVQR
jgi:hypothetical protein